ncbi:protein FAM219A-like [Rhopilema esculentum]|uniref:protein FAM219A-like n=1 Tax=Rhopilema esculentum TaxID=499914 RepID=UPI0031DD9870
MSNNTDDIDDFDVDLESTCLVEQKRNGTVKKTENGEVEPLLKTLRKPSDLQLKLERQVEKSRQISQGKMVSRGSLIVPGKGGFTDLRPEEPPLVALSSSSIDEDFEDVELVSPTDIIFKQPQSPYKHGPEDCTQQLLKDGYRLDELSDDEDLDLILPKRQPQTWCSCENSCVLQ